MHLHRLLRFARKKESVVVVKLNNQLARAQSHSIFSTTMKNQPNDYYSVHLFHTPPPSILTDLNDCDSSTFRLLCSALKPTPTLTLTAAQKKTYQRKGLPNVETQPNKPIGVNKIGKMMKEACAKVGLDYCNGLRAVAITTAANTAGLPEEDSSTGYPTRRDH